MSLKKREPKFVEADTELCTGCTVCEVASFHTPATSITEVVINYDKTCLFRLHKCFPRACYDARCILTNPTSYCNITVGIDSNRTNS